MSFFSSIADLIRDPRNAIAAWIAAGPIVAYGFVFLIIFVETGVVVVGISIAGEAREKYCPSTAMFSTSGEAVV